VVAIADTFGAINLEDIAAPDCFQIEERLRGQLNIPVLHDDQSGTAVVVCAALHNAMLIQEKKKCDIKVACLGAGAAGIGVLRLCREYFGFALEQIHLIDSKGLVTVDRPDLPSYKVPYAKPPTKANKLEDVIKGADVFIGVSKRDLLTKSMVASMADRPIIFAMANPDPEIVPSKAKKVRDDAIVATGRSDYPNQVNNSVCFPYLFRGALDARAKKFTSAMLKAAVRAIAELAHERVPLHVKRAYPNETNMQFGREYILPKQNDKRLLAKIAPAVRNAYKESDV
jgi:malate dehydrogenase (oxaloacetate-decarboxylating)(NADP+)